MKFSGYKLNILKMYFYILTTNNKKNKFKISQYKKIKYKEIYWKIRKTSTKKTENITESKEDTEKERYQMKNSILVNMLILPN